MNHKYAKVYSQNWQLIQMNIECKIGNAKEICQINMNVCKNMPSLPRDYLNNPWESLGIHKSIVLAPMLYYCILTYHSGWCTCAHYHISMVHHLHTILSHHENTFGYARATTSLFRSHIYLKVGNTIGSIYCYSFATIVWYYKIK